MGRRFERLPGTGAIVAAALLLIPGAGSASAADDAATVWAEAGELEAAGAFAEALDVLDDLAADYPQDYILHLQLGWLAFQAGVFHDADRYYTRADELSGGSIEARLGLAWTALRLGRTGDARRRFEELSTSHPEDERVAEGLAAATEVRQWWIGASARALVYGYPGHPMTPWGIGLAAGVSGGYRRLVFGVSYRYGRFTYTEAVPGGTGSMAAQIGPGGPGPVEPSTATTAVDQHELYLTVGAAWERVGVTGHYAYLSSGDLDIGAGHVAGAVGRFSPFGDILLEASYAGFDDLEVFRSSLAWKLPIAGPLYLEPHGALQVVGDGSGDGATPYGSGGLALGIEDDRGAVRIAGRYGREVRPVYLTVPVSYAIGETLVGGTSVDGRIRFAPGWSLTGGIELYRASASLAVGEMGDIAPDDSGHFGLVGSMGVTFEH